jgi:hypothetical protein
LVHYHRDFNDRMGVFKDAPVHDWSSHAADAVRTLAMGLKEHQPKIEQQQFPTTRTMYEGSHNTGWMSV